MLEHMKPNLVSIISTILTLLIRGILGPVSAFDAGLVYP